MRENDIKTDDAVDNEKEKEKEKENEKEKLNTDSNDNSNSNVNSNSNADLDLESNNNGNENKSEISNQDIDCTQDSKISTDNDNIVESNSKSGVIESDTNMDKAEETKTEVETKAAANSGDCTNTIEEGVDNGNVFDE